MCGGLSAVPTTIVPPALTVYPAETRIRAAAKAPMPTWCPSISTVVVPSGDAAVTVPLRPGRISEPSRKSSSPGVNSSSSGMRSTVNADPTGRLAEHDGVGRLVARARDRVAVRARRRVAEHAHDGGLDLVGDDVLPLAGFLVGHGPRQPEHVGEEALGQPVLAHDSLGQLAPRRRSGRCGDRRGRRGPRPPSA